MTVASFDQPIAEQASGLAAAIAAAETRANAGDDIDLATLARSIDEVTSRTASADPEARRAAKAALLALLAGAVSLVDALDQRADQMRGQLTSMRRGHAAGRAYGRSSRLPR